MSTAFAFNLLILFLGDESEVSVEDHLVNSIVILELALEGVSAAISDCKALEVESQGVGLSC